MPPRRESYRHGNVRAEAVAAGLEMVAADGYEGLSLRRVAERVGIAHRSLYNHFADRDALLDAIAEQAYLRQGEALKAAGASDEVLEHVKPILAAQFGTGWDELEAGAAYAPEAGRDLLPVYDPDDERVRHEDADRIAALWPGAEILKTSGHGHNKVLLAPEMWERVGGSWSGRVWRCHRQSC